MSKNLEKRRSYFFNKWKRHQNWFERLGNDPSVPEAQLRDWYIIDDRFRIAEGSIDGPEGEYLAGRAESLADRFTERDVMVGLRVRSAFWKEQNKRRVEHQEWLEYARELLESIDKPYPRGTKSWIAAKVADKFGKETDTVRKRLRELGVWDG